MIQGDEYSEGEVYVFMLIRYVEGCFQTEHESYPTSLPFDDKT